MHVHLLEPLHGWRAFAGEVGVIVLGVLIALGAQQLGRLAFLDPLLVPVDTCVPMNTPTMTMANSIAIAVQFCVFRFSMMRRRNMTAASPDICQTIQSCPALREKERPMSVDQARRISQTHL
jgi:hypothetical protein